MNTYLKGKDTASLRRLSTKAVIELLRSQGPTGRREISLLTGLSFATVCRVLDELAERSVVTEVAAVNLGNARRKTALMDINSQGGWVAVIDIGANRIRAAAMDLSGGLHENLEFPLKNVQGEESVTPVLLSALNSIIELCGKKRGKLRAVGISSSGIVDSQQGLVKLSFNLQLRDYPAARIVQRAWDIPVVVINDVYASTLAEAKYGPGKQHSNFAYITVGTGIGAGLVFDGRVRELPVDAEFGLMVVAAEGDPDRFSGRGYLESLASGKGIAAAARRALESGASSILSGIAEGGPAFITAKDVAEAAAQGDEVAVDAFAKAANYLGIAIVNLAHTLGLTLFIISGGVASAGEAFWKPLRESVEKYEFWPGRIRLEPSVLQKDAALLGIGIMALDKALEIAD